MKQLFTVFHREHNTHMLCEMEKLTNIWPRQPQQDFIMPLNIRLHRHPHCPNFCKIFCHTSSVLTCRNCTVCHTMFMMLYAGHFITDSSYHNSLQVHILHASKCRHTHTAPFMSTALHLAKYSVHSSASTRLGSLHRTIQLQSAYQSFVQYHP